MNMNGTDPRIFVQNDVCIDRRSFLVNSSRALNAVVAALLLGKLSLKGDILYAAGSGAVGDVPLCKIAAAKGLLYGGVAGYGKLSSDAAFAELVAEQCRVLVPENEFVLARLCPDPGRYDFTQADWMASFARKHNMLMFGHSLVWHEVLPKWFAEKINSQNAEKTMLEHISKVVGRYSGRMYAWDVVNEAVAPWEKRPDGLRNTPWLKLLGPRYIENSFRAAANADPKALLVLNQNHLEYDTDESTRNATLRLLENLKKNGAPVHGLGIQAHLRGDERRFTPSKLRGFLRQVADLGLKILITELDVEDQKLPADIEARDRIVANRYDEFLSSVLAEPAVIAVMTWGLSDRSTWLASYKPREDGLPVRPLPFDKDLRPKSARYAIANAFRNAPSR
jgi:endo-1,4-beta-xylanase